MSGYAVKESFLTLQGEGLQAGRRAVFVRFSGCNLWSGRERDRVRAECTFCDTDFVGTDGDGGGRFTDADALADHALHLWRRDLADDPGEPLVVLTGGEPMLQLDGPLVDALKARGFRLAIETNGTLPVHPGVDWICVSPKAGTTVVQRAGQELKVVWPQAGLDMAEMASWRFDHHLVQPIDHPAEPEARDRCVEWVLAHPGWRLSLQTHKALGLR